MSTETLSPGAAALGARVRTFMRQGVVTLPDDASLLEAQQAMLAHGVRAVLVIGRAHRRALGWITMHGMVAGLPEDPARIPAAQAVTEPATLISPDATAAEARALLCEPGTSHLLVSRVLDGPALGVVSDVDVVRLVLSQAGD